MTNRQTAITDFLNATDWREAQRVTVAGDASNRRYDRLTLPDGATAILMDAPPEKGEDIRPFVRIAQHLTDIGLNAPDVYAKDETLGFLILEDLGDDLFARVLEKSPDLEQPLYEAAVDVLTHLHKAPTPTLMPYDTNLMTEMAALPYGWYILGATGQTNAAKTAAFVATFTTLLAPLETAPRVLIQRDYHAENLLWMPQRDGVQKVGLLDFQDAMSGHSAYDLVSILQDARRDVSAQIQTEMKARYIDQNGLDADDFNAAYAVLGLQRNMRILGVFARLCMRDGKAHYVDFIPRVWAYIEENLHHPTLASIAEVILGDLPYPDENILARLKEKCATVPHL
jgi:aminoglycoside/choline kinase family phosphotransferase